MARRRPPELDRDAALRARPLRLPVIRTEPRDSGGLLVTVMLRRSRWQRLLGMPEGIERTFGLDLAGRTVYDACDGRSTVKQIVRRFAEVNSLNPAEAEMAVTAFLKSLVSKGLVAMEVDRRNDTPGKKS